MSNISVSPGPSGPIAVRITSISQLFNSLDPFPFQERDLDEKAEEFIVGWARELPRDQSIRLELHLPVAEVEKPECKDVGAALQRYFSYHAGLQFSLCISFCSCGWCCQNSGEPGKCAG